MKRWTAAIIAAVFTLVFAAVPARLLRAEELRTPEGYNAHDYAKLAAFLEMTDAEGVKNGQKLDPGYDPEDPATWTGCVFSEGEEKRIVSVTAPMRGLAGALDLNCCFALQRLTLTGNSLWGLDVSYCTSLTYLLCGNNALSVLDLSGCTGLMYVYVFGNQLTAINVSDCPALDTLNVNDNSIGSLDLSGKTAMNTLSCANNQLTALDVADSAGMYYIDCHGNGITELNVSGLAGLNTLDCSQNALTSVDIADCGMLRGFDCRFNYLREIDMSNNPWLYFDRVTALGHGWVGLGVIDGGDYYSFEVRPMDDAGFIGWYDDNGMLMSISTGFVRDCYAVEIYGTEVEARIERIAGDADGSDDIGVFDALLVLRYAMGLAELPAEALASCDVDGNGETDVQDALAILRYAMGLLEEL